MKTIRCAIYTRKSSEEGLEQGFNSLDAQREACAAYILSQASEGWITLPEIYDDGGISGGTLARPALQRLLADVAANRIDIIVVYKVDRLTRSLLDFAKLVEAFDKAGTSFVSITQSFNTTTSMGRLTLNMLLSFAQFEREVTAERIRDKIAASKAKGMWMGGTPPLGYEPDGRSLAIVDDQAEIVRQLFARYLDFGGVRELVDAMNAEGSRVPVRTAITGKVTGGGAWQRGQVYLMLKNPIYIGLISHRGKTYAGRHLAIISKDVFERVQAQLAVHRRGSRRRARQSSLYPLAGKLFDEHGEPLIGVHSTKAGVRYRYYVAKAAHHASQPSGLPARRIPASEVEALVVDRLKAAFADPLLELPALADLGVQQLGSILARATQLVERIGEPDSRAAFDLIESTVLAPSGLSLRLSATAVNHALGCEIVDKAIELAAQARITRTGRTLRLIQNDGFAAAVADRPQLARLIVRGRSWWARIRAGEASVSTIANEEGVSRSYVSRLVRLAFLAPDIVEAVTSGKLGPGVETGALLRPGAIDLSWDQQRARLRPAA
jgi:site-specific DNA recombinase